MQQHQSLSFKLNANVISGALIVLIFKKKSYLLSFKYTFHVKGVIVEQVLSINWLSASLTSLSWGLIAEQRVGGFRDQVVLAIVDMLKAHYTLKCTSWLISPDLLLSCVTPPTTSVCKEGCVGTNSLVHLWRKVRRGACGLKTLLSVLLMGAARTFQLPITPSDRKTFNILRCRSFRMIILHQNFTTFFHWKWSKIKSLQRF